MNAEQSKHRTGAPQSSSVKPQQRYLLLPGLAKGRIGVKNLCRFNKPVCLSVILHVLVLVFLASWEHPRDNRIDAIMLSNEPQLELARVLLEPAEIQPEDRRRIDQRVEVQLEPADALKARLTEDRQDVTVSLLDFGLLNDGLETMPDSPSGFRSGSQGLSGVRGSGASLAAEGHSGPSGSFFEVAIQGRRVVFVLDASRSMGALMNSGRPIMHEVAKRPGLTKRERRKYFREVSEADADNRKLGFPTRFDRVVDEVRRTFQEPGFDETVDFSIVLFRQRAFVLEGGLQPATFSNEQKAIRWLKTFQPEGGTLAMSGLQQAFQLAADEIFFLTDGALMGQEHAVRGALESRDHEVRVNTIFLGHSGDGRALAAMSLATGGQFRQVDEKPVVPAFTAAPDEF